MVDGKDKYDLVFNLGTNPKQTIVELKVRRLEAIQVINLVGAVANFEIEPPKQEVIHFEDVESMQARWVAYLERKSTRPGLWPKAKPSSLGKRSRSTALWAAQG